MPTFTLVNGTIWHETSTIEHGEDEGSVVSPALFTMLLWAVYFLHIAVCLRFVFTEPRLKFLFE